MWYLFIFIEFFIIIFSRSCTTNTQEHCDGSAFINGPITIASDNTAPGITLSWLPGNESITNYSPSQKYIIEVTAAEMKSLLLTATGKDSESGIKYTYIYSFIPPPEAPVDPTDPYAERGQPLYSTEKPTYQNLDPEQNKGTGSQACEQRTTVGQPSLETPAYAVRRIAKFQATTENFMGIKSSTPVVTFVWNNH